MSENAIWCGRLLIIIGIIGYGWGLYQGAASPTALIPAVFGVILMFLGHAAAARENLRKHLMHAALLVALIGFIAAVFSVFRKGLPETVSSGFWAQVTMAIICLSFVVLGIRSFIDARRGAS